MAADQQVLGHGHVREELGVLEGAAHPCERDLVDWHMGDVAAIEHDVARKRPIHAVDAIEERGLTSAVRSDDRDQLAIGGIKRHAVEGRETPEAQAEIANLERHQLHHRRLRRYCLMSR